MSNENVFFLIFVSAWLLRSYFWEWKCSQFLQLVRKWPVFMAAARPYYVVNIELFLDFGIAFLSKLSKKYQGITAVQACKTKPETHVMKYRKASCSLDIFTNWKQLTTLTLFILFLHCSLSSLSPTNKNHFRLQLKNPVYFNPHPKFLPSDSIPHIGHWKLPIFHWWCHRESLHQSRSGQVPESGFDYQLGDARLIPGTN